MITPMSKIELFVLKEDLAKAVGLLHNLGLLHIEQIHLTKIMEQRGISRISLNPQQEKERALLEALIKEINALIQSIRNLARSCTQESTSSQIKNIEEKTSQELIDMVNNQLKPSPDSINKQMAILKDEQSILPQYKEILESFLISKRELKVHQDLSCLALIFDRRYEKDMQIFKKHLQDKTKSHLGVYIAPLSPKKIVALVFYPPAIAKQIDEGIFKKGTVKIELPSKYLSQPLNETIKFIQDRLSQIPAQIARLNKDLLDFVQKNISLICAIRTTALNRLEKIQILNNFLESKYSTVITGWLPTKDLIFLNQELEKSFGSSFAIYDRTQFVKRTSDIPVLLDNPKALKPYELLLSLLPLPKYGTRDATGLLSLFFPIFFGLIVGDIGYGLIFLVFSLFLKKSPKFFARSIGAIIFAVSLSSILFGILFGELFGNLGRDYFGLHHILFDRQESIVPFLILALSVGVCHVVLGFFLGLIEAFRKKHKKEGLEKIAILGGLMGLFLLVASMVNIMPSRFLPPSIVLLVVAVVLLIILKGFIGPLEMISAVANILSYARLMALGLAGVMMATIANHIGGLSENIFIGIILAALLHGLNLVLSVFSPTIQSLRLHYVEFFSKFYEPGGKKYNPFRKKEVVECIH